MTGGGCGQTGRMVPRCWAPTIQRCLGNVKDGEGGEELPWKTRCEGTSGDTGETLQMTHPHTVNRVRPPSRTPQTVMTSIRCACCEGPPWAPQLAVKATLRKERHLPLGQDSWGTGSLQHPLRDRVSSHNHRLPRLMLTHPYQQQPSVAAYPEPASKQYQNSVFPN